VGNARLVSAAGLAGEREFRSDTLRVCDVVQGLKAVTRKTLGYDPLELDPELMLQYAR
jgi:hypothetical protein